MNSLPSQKTNEKRVKRENGPGHAGGPMTGKRTEAVEIVTGIGTGRAAAVVVMTVRAERLGALSGLPDIGHAALMAMMIEVKERKGQGHLMTELNERGKTFFLKF